MNFALIKAFLIALPELIRLIRLIQERHDEAAVADQLKKDLAGINEAFEKKDPELLRRLFDS